MPVPIRQQALATAQVYLRRFYSKVEIRKTNPYIVITTALYLACKLEECAHHIKNFVNESRALWPCLSISLLKKHANLLIRAAFITASEIAKVGECEFYLISEMSSQMIVHHPYRTLLDLQTPLNLSQDDVSMAWSVINDHYLTDLPLLYPPHVIAIAAIFLALTLRQPSTNAQQPQTATANMYSQASLRKDASDPTITGTTTQQKKSQHLVNWLSESNVNIKAVMECCQEIISLYDLLETYQESVCKEAISRFTRAQGLDK